MARDWDSQFNTWSKPPSDTEDTRCENAASMIRKAIAASTALSGRGLRTFAQGSYCYGTNVRKDSDVDVCVLCTDTFFYDVAEGVTIPTGTISPVTYRYSQFKDEVGAALRSYFGNGAVTRGKKAFDIHENTYRVDADVVPCFEYRYYFRNWNGTLTWNTGVAFEPDNGGRIHNYPEQNYKNGVTKNQNTSQRFKKIVRIVKNLRNEMNDNSAPAAKPIPSFLLECLAWNVPDNKYGNLTYRGDVGNVISVVYDATETDEKCKNWCEENGLKYLFHVLQPWTRAQVNAFTVAAWNHAEYNK